MEVIDIFINKMQYNDDIITISNKIEKNVVSCKKDIFEYLKDPFTLYKIVTYQLWRTLD